MKIEVMIGEPTKKEWELIVAVTSGDPVKILGRKYLVLSVERDCRGRDGKFIYTFELHPIISIAKASQ